MLLYLREVLVFVVACAPLFVACALTAEPRAELERTTDEARRILAVLLPGAKVDDVRVEVLRAASARKALTEARARPGFLDVGELLRSQLAIPVRFRVLGQAEADVLVEEFSARDIRMTDADAVAIPSEGLVLVSEEKVGSLRVVAHEFAHVITDRAGYFSERRPDAFLSPGEDPRRLDLDALLTLWALSEGGAEFTSLAVAHWKQRGALGLNGVWAQNLQTDLSRAGLTLSGPARMTRPDGAVVDVKVGETYSLPPSSLGDVLTHFVYNMSAHLFQLAKGEDGTLESAIRSTWKRTPLRSMSIVSPGDLPSAAGLMDGVSTQLRPDDKVSHLGAVLVWDFLVRKVGEDPRAASALLGDFVDDLAVLCGEKATWIVRWRTEAAASNFAAARDRLLSEKPIRLVDDGGLHVVICGDTEMGKALLGR